MAMDSIIIIIINNIYVIVFFGPGVDTRQSPRRAVARQKRSTQKKKKACAQGVQAAHCEHVMRNGA